MSFFIVGKAHIKESASIRFIGALFVWIRLLDDKSIDHLSTQNTGLTNDGNRHMKPFFIFLLLLISVGIFSQNEKKIYFEIQLELKYKNLVQAANKLMLENNYAQAELKYYEALQLLPGKVYAKNQLEKAKGLREKRHQISLINKDTIFSTFTGDSLFIPKLLEYSVHPRPDTTVLVLSKIVGESIELKEKIKFGLLNNIDNSSFAYALYISSKGKILVEVKFIDGTTTSFPYTIQELMNDAQKTDRLQINNPSSFIPILDVKGRLRLKVKKMESKKADNFKEGHHFYYTTHEKIEGLLPVIGRTYTYDDQYMMYAKILKILNNGQPAIEIEKVVSGFSKIREIILLSDIIEISKTLNSTRFKIDDDSVLFIESF